MQSTGSTSVEGLRALCPGELIALGSGPHWHGLQVEYVERHDLIHETLIPAVPEPQVAWIIEGEAEFQERELGGEWTDVRVKPGDIFLTTSPRPYESRWRRTGPAPLRVLQVYVSLALLTEAARDLLGETADVPHIGELSGQKDPTVQALLGELKRELTERPSSQLFIQSVGRALAVHLVRTYGRPGTRRRSSGMSAFQLHQVKQQLETHLDQPESLAELARSINMSEFHFSRSFKKATGLPLTKYLTHIRMQKARQLLRETNRTMLDISAEVGYSSQSHFAEVFRSHVGVTPTDYRNWH